MSYLHVQQLGSIRDEFAAASAALAYLVRVWHELGDEPEIVDIRFTHVRAAVVHLEDTYTIRLFSEFEGILQRHLIINHPGLRMPRTTEALINRVALRERIPDPLRIPVQGVREFRNSIVHHQQRTPTVEQSFREVLAALNCFLARLP